jgi:hypothetical protein
MRALMAPKGLVHVPSLFFCQVWRDPYDVRHDDEDTTMTWVAVRPGRGVYTGRKSGTGHVKSL